MIIGVGGVSRAGKTSLAFKIREWLGYDQVSIIHQDEFIQPMELMPKINGHIDWEHPDSLDFIGLFEKVKSESKIRKFVVVEGLMVFWSEEILNLLDKKIYLKIGKEAFLSRKTLDNRWGDEPDWYIEHIWNNHFIYGNLPDHATNILQLDGEASCIDNSTKKILKPKIVPMITKDIEIEDLVSNYPFSVRYLSQHGIRCIACGEPIWGTLEEAAKEKGFDDAKIDAFLSELNDMANKNPK